MLETYEQWRTLAHRFVRRDGLTYHAKNSVCASPLVMIMSGNEELLAARNDTSMSSPGKTDMS